MWRGHFYSGSLPLVARNGQPRKLVMQAARNGYFYVLDRVTGEHLLTSKFSPAANWATRINSKGAVVRDPEKDSTIPGSLVSPPNGGATNWPPPSFDPQTGLFYVGLHQGYAMYYLTLTAPRFIMGLGGKGEDGVGGYGNSIIGIDYWRQLENATSRAGVPCRQSKPGHRATSGSDPE